MGHKIGKLPRKSEELAALLYSATSSQCMQAKHDEN